MNSSIESTKKHLTIVFSIIVFIVVFILWITFFSAKYYKVIHNQKNDFFMFINSIETSKNHIDNFMNVLPQFGSLRNNEVVLIWVWDIKWADFSHWWEAQIEPFMPKGFINFIHLNKENKIINIDVKDEVSEKFILSIIQDKSFLNVKQKSWFLIKKHKLEDESFFIFFKKLPYSLNEYLEDVFWFLLISILFSFLIYYIWIRFVNKIFIPVENNIKDMNDFIHNAWHELKTPISVIDSNIQLLKEMKTYDETMVLELKSEVIKLNSLIDSLVKLSDVDLFKEIEDINLESLINEILNDFKFKIDDKKIKVKIDVPKDIIIKWSRNYIYIYLSNIIWNAIKYNKIMWLIEINYKNNILSIKDTWVWIKKEDLSKIWDRFFKSDSSRNSSWFGIWLSLVKKIWDMYWWQISVESDIDVWTKFNIKF